MPLLLLLFLVWILLPHLTRVVSGVRMLAARGNNGRWLVVCSFGSLSNNQNMSYSKEDALSKARNDLAKRLGVKEQDVREGSVEETDFPDTSLGAGSDDEMSGQMITRGWRIQLEAQGKTFEYRADKNQLRAYKFKGKNYRV